MDTNIEIANGRVFVNIDGEKTETSDPTVIGYAILDFAENMDKNGKIVLIEKDDHVELLK